MSVNRSEWNKLRDALEQGEFVAAANFLQSTPDLIHARNGIGETVLHFLAVEENLAAVEWLHTRGADLNAKNGFGVPLQFEVALLEYLDLFVWLLEHGADRSAKTADGEVLEEFLADHNSSAMLDFVAANNNLKF